MDLRITEMRNAAESPMRCCHRTRAPPCRSPCRRQRASARRQRESSIARWHTAIACGAHDRGVASTRGVSATRVTTRSPPPGGGGGVTRACTHPCQSDLLRAPQRCGGAHLRERPAQRAPPQHCVQRRAAPERAVGGPPRAQSPQPPRAPQEVQARLHRRTFVPHNVLAHTKYQLYL